MVKKQSNLALYVTIVVLVTVVVVNFQSKGLMAVYPSSFLDCRNLPSDCRIMYYDNQTETARQTYGLYACTAACEINLSGTPGVSNVGDEQVYEKSANESEEGVNIGGEWFKKVTEYDYKTWYLGHKIIAWILAGLAGIFILLQVFFKDERVSR